MRMYLVMEHDPRSPDRGVPVVVCGDRQRALSETMRYADDYAEMNGGRVVYSAAGEYTTHYPTNIRWYVREIEAR